MAIENKPNFRFELDNLFWTISSFLFDVELLSHRIVQLIRWKHLNSLFETFMTILQCVFLISSRKLRTISTFQNYYNRIKNKFLESLSVSHSLFTSLSLSYPSLSLFVKCSNRLLFYRVFIYYCVFSKILKDSGLLPFSVFPRCQWVYLVYTHTRQVEHQRCSRTGRVQKNHKILRKKHNI